MICRDKLLESLSEYIAVDVYGKCGNLTCEKKILNDNNKVLEPIISLNESSSMLFSFVFFSQLNVFLMIGYKIWQKTQINVAWKTSTSSTLHLRMGCVQTT